MQNTIILLVEQIVGALGTEFKIYLPQIIPQILRVFMHDNSPGRTVTAKVGQAYTGNNLYSVRDRSNTKHWQVFWMWAPAIV